MNDKRILILLLFAFLFGASSNVYGQSNNPSNAYISTSSKLYSSTSDTAKVITRLDKYSNLQVVDTTSTHWLHIKFNGQTGYVKSSSTKPGKAVVTHHTYRTGARCEDGSHSNATGRGACSHHGGVDYWLTKTNESVSVIDN